MYRYEPSKKYTVHLELTDKCNAACPMCQRTNIEPPSSVEKPRANKTASYIQNVDLTLEDIQTIWPEKTLQQYMKHIHMCGSFGDPMMARDVYEITDYFLKSDPRMECSFSTNASLRDEDWWFKFGCLANGRDRRRLTVMFCIDGLTQETHEMYRRDTNLDKIWRNVDAYMDSGARATWQFISFKHNDHEVERARKMSADMGFERFELVKTPRFGARDNGWPYNYNGNEFRLEASSLYANDNWMKNPENIKLKTVPGYEKKETDTGHYIDCKVQNVPSFYVDCEGFVLPCCYLASPFYRARHNWSNEIYHFHDCWNDLWADMDVWELNAKHNRLFEDILHKHKWFSDLEIMWKTSSPAVCNKICGNKEMATEREIVL